MGSLAVSRGNRQGVRKRAGEKVFMTCDGVYDDGEQTLVQMRGLHKKRGGGGGVAGIKRIPCLQEAHEHNNRSRTVLV